MAYLDSVVPLKPGEKHCPYCMGYGGIPTNRNRETIHNNWRTCLQCLGSGKVITGGCGNEQDKPTP